MKKTLTVNLGGTVYHIDEDAYRLLDRYLTNLRYCFKKESDVEEIMRDFELRIAEHFSEKLREGYLVITIGDVEEVITQMGKPEELQSDAGVDETGSPKDKKEPVRKKLFRNPDDKMLGGVASGLAAYLGIDVTLVRVFMLLMFFLPWGSVVFIYIILWVLMPLARTTADKLAMRGERITVENIGRTVTEGFERVCEPASEAMNEPNSRTVWQKAGDLLVDVAGILIKVFLVLCVIVFSPVLFLLILVLFAFAVSMIAMLLGGGAYLYSLIPDTWMALASHAPAAVNITSIICLILLIGIPLFGVMQQLLAYFFSSWKHWSSTLKWTLLGLWLVAFIVMLVLLTQNPWMLPSLEMIV